MANKIELLKKIRSFLDDSRGSYDFTMCSSLIDDIDEEFAKPEAEPVAWMREWEGDISDLGNMIFAQDKSELDDSPNWIPLYTSSRPMQRLTESEIYQLGHGKDCETFQFAHAIMDAMIEKNR